MKTKLAYARPQAAFTLAWLIVASSAARGQDLACQRVYFSVLDRSAKPETGLNADDFSLRVGRQRMRLDGFRGPLPANDRSVPLVAWVLVDFNPNVNAAILERQADEAGSILGLFHSDSLIGVKLVSDRLETLAPLGHDAAALRQAFSGFARRRTEVSAAGARGEVPLGRGGILRAIEYAIRETDDAIAARPGLARREVRKAIMVLSDGNVDPGVKRAPVYNRAAAARVFLYPVFVPRPQYGNWLRDYFDLAWKTAGVPSVFGALAPGGELTRLPKGNTGPNALTFNFMHMMRDLNGKYSFCLPEGVSDPSRMEMKCRVSGVRVLLP